VLPLPPQPPLPEAKLQEAQQPSQEAANSVQQQQAPESLPIKKRGRPPKNQNVALKQNIKKPPNKKTKAKIPPKKDNDIVSSTLSDHCHECSPARMKIIKTRITALLECPGLASGIVHNVFHLQNFLSDCQMRFGEPPHLTWMNCINKTPIESYPVRLFSSFFCHPRYWMLH